MAVHETNDIIVVTKIYRTFPNTLDANSPKTYWQRGISTNVRPRIWFRGMVAKHRRHSIVKWYSKASMLENIQTNRAHLVLF